ncbi:MAG: transposase, partial [Flavobacteriaceae bacterium]|nr:transposase [Flavobacteriaceae bacterium]
YEIRDIFDGIFYLLKTGCQWRMLPLCFPPWQTVYYYFTVWKHKGTIELIHDHLRDKVRIKAGSGKEAHELLPHVHLVDSLVKRWINGTHQGSISPKYLSYYLDEFAFRFNRKLSTYRGKLFYRLMQQAVDTAPQPFKELIKST